jgi:ATP-binding cassette, subfamily B, bacterial PglK
MTNQHEPSLLRRRSLISVVVGLADLLDPRERRSAMLLLVFGVGTTFLDVSALLLLMPTVTLLATGEVPGLLSTGASPVAGWTANEVLGLLAAACLGLFLLRSVCGIAGLAWALRSANRVEASVVGRLLDRSATSEYVSHLDTRHSQILRSVSDAAARVGELTAIGLSTMGDAALVLVVGATVLLVSPLAGGLMLVFVAGASLAWTWYSRRRLALAGQVSARLVQDRLESIEKGFTMAREIRLAGRSRAYATQAFRQTAALTRAQRLVTFMVGTNRYVIEGIVLIGLVATGAVAVASLGSEAALPTLAFILAAMFRAVPSAYRLMQFANVADYSGPYLALVAADIEGTTVGDGSASQEPGRKLLSPPQIQLRGVSLRFPRTSADVLTDVNLTLEPGSRLGIVGPSGSGKSTLLEILAGLRDPSRGTILLDGRPLAELRMAFQSSIGFSAQDAPLVNASVAENLAPGLDRSSVNETEAVQALDAVGLSPWLESLPQGIDTLLGPLGPRMSGGERQRLGLARALYVRPVLLVLDEVTAHLDEETRADLIGVLARLDANVTQVIVTHEPRDLVYCDQVVEIRAGRLAHIDGAVRRP